MYKPTEELLELGFRFIKYEGETDLYQLGDIMIIDGKSYIKGIPFLPESTEDIKTLIRLFKLK